MLTFVLGGGGTKGAAQAGAIRALFERGIVPDMLVGTSAGAINASLIANSPTLEGAQRLENAWRALTSEDLLGSGRRSAAWRTVRGRPSLYSSENLREFMLRHGPEVDTFATVNIELYIVASELRTGRPYVFGDKPNEKVVDAVIASTAVPPVFPPVLHNNVWLVDGGVASNLLRIAIQRGATEIYAIDISNQPPRIPENMRVWTVTELSVSAMVRQQVRDELTWARLQPGVKVHRMRVPFNSATSMWDVDTIEEFLELGYASAKLFLIRRALPQRERSALGTVWQAAGLVRRGANALVRGVTGGVKGIIRLLWRRGQADLVEDSSIGRDGLDLDAVGSDFDE
jgi:NTE family protein